MAAIDEDEKEKAKETKLKLLKDLTLIEREIHDFEEERSSLFDKTADVRAENQLVMWWVFSLAHSSDKEDPKDEDFEPIFGLGSFDD